MSSLSTDSTNLPEFDSRRGSLITSLHEAGRYILQRFFGQLRGIGEAENQIVLGGQLSPRLV